MHDVTHGCSNWRGCCCTSVRLPSFILGLLLFVSRYHSTPKVWVRLEHRPIDLRKVQQLFHDMIGHNDLEDPETMKRAEVRPCVECGRNVCGMFAEWVSLSLAFFLFLFI